MKPGQSIKVQLVDDKGDALPIGNVEISVQFMLRGQKVYQFALGLTDSTGTVTATYDDLEARRRQGAQVFLMDYNTKLEDTDPSVRILLESDHEISKRREYAARIFGRQEAETVTAYSNYLVKPQAEIVGLGEAATVVRLKAQRS